MLNTVVLSINNWCQVNSKWTVTEGVRPTDVFLFLRFFCEILQRYYLNTEYTFAFFFLFPRTWINSLCPANMVIYLKENTMNPHKEKIIINRNISEIPFNVVYLILSPRPSSCLFVVLYFVIVCTRLVYVIVCY